MKTGGASTLEEILAGQIDTNNIKTRLRTTAKKNLCFVKPMPELFSVENSSTPLFKVENLVEQVMEQTNKQ